MPSESVLRLEALLVRPQIIHLIYIIYINCDCCLRLGKTNLISGGGSFYFEEGSAEGVFPSSIKAHGVLAAREFPQVKRKGVRTTVAWPKRRLKRPG